MAPLSIPQGVKSHAGMSLPEKLPRGMPPRGMPLIEVPHREKPPGERPLGGMPQWSIPLEAAPRSVPSLGRGPSRRKQPGHSCLRKRQRDTYGKVRLIIPSFNSLSIVAVEFRKESSDLSDGKPRIKPISRGRSKDPYEEVRRIRDKQARRQNGSRRQKSRSGSVSSGASLTKQLARY